MLKHFAVYNTTTHEYDDPGNVGPIDDTITEEVKNQRDKHDKNGIIIGKEEFVVGVINLAEQRARVLGLECVGRGTLNGEWKVYAKDEPFDWNNLVGNIVLSATEKAAYDKAVKEASEKAVQGG